MQLAISLTLALLLFLKLSRTAKLVVGVLAVAGHIHRAIGLGERLARKSSDQKKKGAV